MLSIIEYGKDVYDFPALIVLGCFDAIHVGHRELLKKAKLQAKINGLDLGVMMFRNGKTDKLIASFEERVAMLEQFNVKFVVAIDFDEEFKKTAPLDFLQNLEDKINVKAYMSGKDFRFGAGAKGKSSTLKNYAEDEENGVWYMPVKDVTVDGEKVGTSLIKSFLDAGDVAKANELLGYEYFLSGEVVKREGRGTSQVGFPTANIEFPRWKYPVKQGVYSVACKVGDVDYQGIANFGTCPTFDDERVALEVYLDGFSGDLYGQVLTVRFINFLREIETFGSADELSEQLKSDLATANSELGVTEAVAEELAEDGFDEIIEEQPVEEVVEEITEEQPAEEVVEEVIEEQPAEEVAEEVIEEQPVEEVVEEVIEEQPAEEVVEEVTEEQPAEEVVEEVTEEQPAEEVVEEVIKEQPVEEIVEEVIKEQPAEEVVEEVIEEQPVEEVAEEVIEEQPVEEIVEEVIEEQPAEEVAEEVTEDTASDEGEDGVD